LFNIYCSILDNATPCTSVYCCPKQCY